MPGLVQSVERAAAILSLLSDEGGMTLGRISDALGLAKGTAHGLLRTLEDVGFVEQDQESRAYGLGRGALQLGSTVLDLNELRSATLNWVDTLAVRTGEAAGIAAFRGGELVVAHHVPGRTKALQRTQTGSVLPLHASALGKILLAFDPGAARSIVGQSLESFTFRTITDRSRLMSDLAGARERDLAISLEELEPNHAEIAAPVRDHSGYVVAAVGIDGTIARLCDDRLNPRLDLMAAVGDVALSISRALGHGTST